MVANGVRCEIVKIERSTFPYHYPGNEAIFKRRSLFVYCQMPRTFLNVRSQRSMTTLKHGHVSTRNQKSRAFLANFKTNCEVPLE